jgi:hypothetical protein
MSDLRTPEAQQLAELAIALADADRLSRGRRYQRKGNVSAVFVATGAATAEVQGSRTEPYEVTIAVRTANENVRRAVADGDVSAAVPRAGELAVTCVCPDWGDPCKHGVAALLALAAEIDDDPSLLLRWRGIDDIVPPPPAGSEPLDQPSRAVSSVDPDAAPDADSGARRGPRRRPPTDAGERSSTVRSPHDGPVDRLAAVRALRERMGDRVIVDASELIAPGGRRTADDRPIAPSGPLAAFFDGAMPPDGAMPVERLTEVQLDIYRRLAIMVDTHDAAPVIADAIETISDHWLGR